MLIDFKMKTMIKLFVIFLILKLTNIIDWSWFWVSSPLWIPIFLVILLGFLAFWFLVLFDNPS
jgi:hypothetical protein|tara:strand:+ start:1484 stop:1672 length:189 start_codon:yes stop_codon:yes gene_type:complete